MGLDWPWVFLLLPPAVTLVWLRRKRPFLRFPSLGIVPRRWEGRTVALISAAFPVLLLFLLILLAAGPRFPVREGQKYGYGADIIFLLDESGSMSESFGAPSGPGPQPQSAETPTRFSAAKKVIAGFMEKRKSGLDRYGLTVFGTSAVRVLPLTFDHRLFLDCLEAQEGILQSTSFNYPLALGLDELMRSGARSRVLVLVSDGSGPLEDDLYGFSKLIVRHGIRFYWISIGSEVFQELPKFLARLGPLARQMDALNPSELEAGFADIHNLERSLIVYRESAPVLTPRPFIYSGCLLMTVLWSSYSLFVYQRKRRKGEP